MPRVIISVPSNYYSSDRMRCVLPDVPESDVDRVMSILARAVRVRQHNVGDQSVNVVEPTAVVSVEIIDADTVMTPKQHATAVAEWKERRASEQADEARKSRAAAEAVEA